MMTTQEKLMRAFDFTEDDLSANQRGLISEHQRTRLRGMVRGIGGCSIQTALIAFGFVFLGFCLILASFLQNEESRQALFSNPLNIVLLGLSVLAVLVLLAGAAWWNRKQAAGLTNAPLMKVEGLAKVTKEHFKRGGSGYRIKIGEKDFRFIERYGGGFQDGTAYRIYYCQSGAYEPILSIEVL